MSFLTAISRLMRGEVTRAQRQADETQGALRQLLTAQVERKEAAQSTNVAAKSNVRAYRAEKERIQQRTKAQADKRKPGTTSYAKEQVENLLTDLDRDVARAVRGECEDGVSE